MAVGTLDPRRGLLWQDTPMSQDEIDRQRLLADAVLKGSQSTAPIGDWTQGAAQVVNALGGVLRERRLDKAQAENTNTNASLMASLLGSNASPDTVATPGSAPASVTLGVPIASAAPAVPPEQIKSLIAENVPPEMQAYATNLIGKESSFNPSAVSPTGATGLAQFTRGTGSRYGLVGPNGDMRADPVANVKALVALTNDNRNALAQALGRPPTDGELALAHQQGAQGAINLLSGKSVPAQNLAVNGVSPGTDPRAAAQKIMNYYGGGAPAAPTQVASLDPSAGMGSIPPATVAPGQPAQGMAIPVPTARPDQAAQTPLDPATATPSQMMGALGIDPQATASAQPVVAGAPAIAPQQQVAEALVNRPAPMPAPAITAAPSTAISPAVIAALTSKSASPATKQVALALLQRQQTQQAQQQQFVLDQKKAAYEQQLKQQDPMYQQTLRKAQYENDHLGQVSPDTQATLAAQEKAAKTAADNAWIMADHQQELKASDPLQQANVAKTNAETANVNETPDIKEYNFAKQTGYKGSFAQYQLDMKQAARPTTTINTGDNSGAFAKKADEEAATRFGGYISDGSAASRTLGDVQQLADLGTQISTGKGAQALVALGPYAEAVGIDIKGLGPAQAYQSIISRVAPQMRPTGSGSSSDTDVKMFLNGLPSLGNSPQGNQIITQTLAAVQQQKIEAAKIASQAMMPKESGGITWQEAEQKIRDLGNPYETFNKYRQTLSQNGTQSLPSDNLTVPTTIPGVTIRRKN